MFERSLFFGHWAGTWKTIIHSSKNDNIYLLYKNDNTLFKKWWLGTICQILTLAHTHSSFPPRCAWTARCFWSHHGDQFGGRTGTTTHHEVVIRQVGVEGCSRKNDSFFSWVKVVHCALSSAPVTYPMYVLCLPPNVEIPNSAPPGFIFSIFSHFSMNPTDPTGPETWNRKVLYQFLFYYSFATQMFSWCVLLPRWIRTQLNPIENYKWINLAYLTDNHI